jgi:hypothetical protein
MKGTSGLSFCDIGVRITSLGEVGLYGATGRTAVSCTPCRHGFGYLVAQIVLSLYSNDGVYVCDIS